MRIGFSGGTTEVDKIIQEVSGSQKENITHAFCILCGRPYESEGVKEPDAPYPGVWFSRRGKYDGNPNVTYVDVEVPDEQAFQDKAFELLGTFYGYLDCVTTGLKILTGKDIGIDGEKTMHCSETITRLLRAGGVDVCSTLEPDEVAPVVLFRDLRDNFGGIVSYEVNN